MMRKKKKNDHINVHMNHKDTYDEGEFLNRKMVDGLNQTDFCPLEKNINKDIPFFINYDILLKNCKQDKNYLDLNLEINYNLEEIIENKDNLIRCLHRKNPMEHVKGYKREIPDDYMKNKKYYYDNNIYHHKNDEYYHNNNNNNIYKQRDDKYDRNNYCNNFKKGFTNILKDKKNKEKNYYTDTSYSDDELSYSDNNYYSDSSVNSYENENNKSFNFSQRITYDNNLMDKINIYDNITNYVYNNKNKNNCYYENMDKQNKDCYNYKNDIKYINHRDTVLNGSKYIEDGNYINDKKKRTDIIHFINKTYKDKLSNNKCHTSFIQNIKHTNHEKEKTEHSKFSGYIQHSMAKDYRRNLTDRSIIFNNHMEKNDDSSINLDFLKSSNTSNCKKMEIDILNKYEKIMKIMKYLRKVKSKYPEIETTVSILSNHIKNVTFNCEKMFESRYLLNEFLKKLYIYQIYILKKIVFNKSDILKNDDTLEYYNKHFHTNKMRFISTDRINNSNDPITFEDIKENSSYSIRKLNEQKENIFREKGYNERHKIKEYTKDNKYNNVGGYKENYQYTNEYMKRGNKNDIKNKYINHDNNNVIPYDNNCMYILNNDINKNSGYSDKLKNKYKDNYINKISNLEMIDKNGNKNNFEDMHQINKNISNEKREILIDTNEKKKKISYKTLLISENMEKNNNNFDYKRDKSFSKNNVNDNYTFKDKSFLNKMDNVQNKKLFKNEPIKNEKIIYDNIKKKDYLNVIDEKKEEEKNPLSEHELNLKALNLESKDLAIKQNIMKEEIHNTSYANKNENKKTHVLYNDVNKELSAISNRDSVIHALKYTLLNKPQNFTTLQNFLFKIDVEFVEYKNFVLLISKSVRKLHLEALYGLNDFSIFEKVYGKKAAPRFLISKKVKMFYKYDKFYQKFRELVNVREFSGITDAVEVI
ncbi:hypothetical protein PGSY75_1473300 [Plasmodium gaboni]|uniref:CKK domain-containing protein n=1 Tax=Plasmodium gaboni TaxID=647221 RepID=A0A151LBT0_9APIC|nr:hypothetical protein PGSY75_1473300 [Plasmodium gaboni]KYN96316.1 hypothetical protein PGSY75_1473300 [Plasmodium gaboni]